MVSALSVLSQCAAPEDRNARSRRPLVTKTLPPAPERRQIRNWASKIRCGSRSSIKPLISLESGWRRPSLQAKIKDLAWVLRFQNRAVRALRLFRGYSVDASHARRGVADRLSHAMISNDRDSRPRQHQHSLVRSGCDRPPAPSHRADPPSLERALSQFRRAGTPAHCARFHRLAMLTAGPDSAKRPGFRGQSEP